MVMGTVEGPARNQVHSQGDAPGELEARPESRDFTGEVEPEPYLKEAVTGLPDRCQYTCIRQNFTASS